MGVGAPPLTLHLAYFDAATLAQHEPARRQALYGYERGEAWARLLGCLLRPVLAMAVALEAARKRRVAAATAKAATTPNASLPLVPRRLQARPRVHRTYHAPSMNLPCRLQTGPRAHRTSHGTNLPQHEPATAPTFYSPPPHPPLRSFSLARAVPGARGVTRGRRGSSRCAPR